jgi:hypothetical protein
MATRPFYVVVAWEYVAEPTDDAIAEGDEAILALISDYPHAVMLDRLALVGVRSPGQREQLYGALRYLASKAHAPHLRYALSPPIAVGARWAGWTASGRWEPVNRIARGFDPEPDATTA